MSGAEPWPGLSDRRSSFCKLAPPCQIDNRRVLSIARGVEKKIYGMVRVQLKYEVCNTDIEHAGCFGMFWLESYLSLQININVCFDD